MPSDPEPRGDRWPALLAILAGMALPIAALLPEICRFAPDLNDGAFHLGVARATAERIGAGRNPIDFWIPTWLSGYPLFHHYQPAPYFLVAGAHLLSGRWLPLPTALRAVELLALAAFPATCWLALRWLGRSRVTATAAAGMAFLVSADRRFGIELESFTWYGWGLFTQAVALPLLPLAVAGGFRAVEGRGRTLRFAALLAATTLCHVLYGYIAALSSILALAVSRGLPEFLSRGRRAALLLAQVACLLAFFVVPHLRDAAVHATSVYDPVTKFDSWGSTAVISWMLGGDLLDHGRVPVISALAGVGLYVALRDGWLGGDRAAAWISLCFGFWTLFYFGRPTWGGLVDWIPMTRGLHIERLSSAVHLFALWLAAMGVGEAVSTCRDATARPAVRLAVALALVVGLASATAERARYVIRSVGGHDAAAAAWERESPDLQPILAYLRSHPGRVHAGGKGNWGQRFTIAQAPLYEVLSAEGFPHVGHAPFSWAPTTDFQVMEAIPTERSARLWDVDYLLGDPTVAPPPGAVPAAQSGRFRLWRLPNDGPFSIVRVPLAIEGSLRDATSMIQSWDKGLWSRRGNHAQLLLDGGTSARPILRMKDSSHFASGADSVVRSVFDPPGVFMSEQPLPPRGTLLDPREDGDSASVTVDASEAATLLFRASFHPGWVARIDDLPVPSIALTPGLVGVDVPAGRHRVSLAYEAGAAKWILLLLGVPAALLLDRLFGRRPANGGTG